MPRWGDRTPPTNKIAERIAGQYLPHQKEVFRCDARHVVYVKGRRAGGTHGMALRLVELALERPRTRHVWVDLTQRHVHRAVRRIFAPILRGTGWRWNAAAQMLALGNGSTVDFGSAQRPELIEGFGYGNFAALAAGEPGAPPLHIDGISSLALLHASSGLVAPQVSSLGTLHVASGAALPGISSVGLLHAAGGLVAPQVGSLGTVHAQSGATVAGTSSLGVVHAASGAVVPGVSSLGRVALAGSPTGTPQADTLYRDNVCKGWVDFDGTGTVSIRDAFNVTSITDHGTGDYSVVWDRDFADAGYAVTATAAISLVNFPGSAFAPGSVRINCARREDALGTEDEPVVCVIAFGGQA